MKIKTRLRINAWIALTVVLLMTLSLFWAFREIRRADRNEDLIHELRKAAFERIVLRDEFFLYREDRSSVQWYAKSETLRELIDTASERFTDKEDRDLLREARQNFDATSAGFSTILEKHKQEKRHADRKPVFDEAESRLIGQVLMRSHALIDSIDRLHESTKRTVQKARDRGFVLVVVCILGGGAAIVFNSHLTGRIVAKRVSALNEGVEIIGSGNLGFRIDTEGNDELASLARESNDMAAKLQRSYTSLESLQEEIIERRRAEQALEGSERNLTDIIEFFPDATLVIDADKRVIAWNRAMEEMTGVMKKDMIGQGDYACTVPFYGTRRRHLPDILDMDDEELESKYQHVRRKGNTLYAVTFTPALYGGKGAYVFAAAAPLFDAQGNRAGTIESIRDITEQKQAEDSLRQAVLELEEISFIVNRSPAVAFLWRAAEGWPVEFVSENVTQFGYSPHDLTSGRIPFASIVHPDDLDKVAIEVAQYTRENRDEFTQEYRIVAKSGEVCWIDDRTWIRRNTDGLVTHYQGIVIDITERKQAQEEICRLNEELERRVIDRTTQLDAANKELESFSYSVSHDLRAPLRSIDGFSQALLEEYMEELDDSGKNYLDRIRRATQHMGRLIDDLLNLSKVTRTEFHHESIDLSNMFRVIMEAHRKNHPEKDMDVIIRDGITVRGDPHLMRIAVDNLVDNACKFSACKERPQVEFGAITGGEETVYFVKDNGVGFDMAYVGKLYGAFQRLHSTSEFPGTGIGLATVRRIIHRHGGRVWAEGEVGKGATFYFTLG